MGQAKQRGTREQRIVQSIGRTRKEKEDAKQAAEDWWESLSEEEQQVELKKHREDNRAHMNMRLMMAALGGMNHGG